MKKNLSIYYIKLLALPLDLLLIFLGYRYLDVRNNNYYKAKVIPEGFCLTFEDDFHCVQLVFKTMVNIFCTQFSSPRRILNIIRNTFHLIYLPVKQCVYSVKEIILLSSWAVMLGPIDFLIFRGIHFLRM